MRRAVGRGFGFALGFALFRLAVSAVIAFAFVVGVLLLIVIAAHAENSTILYCVTAPPGCGANGCSTEWWNSWSEYQVVTNDNQAPQFIWCRAAGDNGDS